MSNGMLTYEVCPDTIALSRFIVYGEHAKQKKYNQQNSTNSLNRASGSFFCLGVVPIPKTRRSGLSGSGMFPEGGTVSTGYSSVLCIQSV